MFKKTEIENLVIDIEKHSEEIYKTNCYIENLYEEIADINTKIEELKSAIISGDFRRIFEEEFREPSRKIIAEAIKTSHDLCQINMEVKKIKRNLFEKCEKKILSDIIEENKKIQKNYNDVVHYIAGIEGDLKYLIDIINTLSVEVKTMRDKKNPHQKDKPLGYRER